MTKLNYVSIQNGLHINQSCLPGTPKESTTWMTRLTVSMRTVTLSCREGRRGGGLHPPSVCVTSWSFVLFFSFASLSAILSSSSKTLPSPTSSTPRIPISAPPRKRSSPYSQSCIIPLVLSAYTVCVWGEREGESGSSVRVLVCIYVCIHIHIYVYICT